MNYIFLLVEVILIFLLMVLFYRFGILGFFISYVFTILGCIISYNIFNSRARLRLNNYILKKDKKKLDKVVKNIRKVKFINLCLLISLPFTPAFLVNIACGLANVNKKKYILSLIIGKLFLVIFWGFIGTSIIDSIRNPLNFIFIGILLILCFIVSRLVSKKEGLE